MDMLDAIFFRKSIRKYTDQPVQDELVNDLLRAAVAVPSAGNEQAWQFIVIRDQLLLDAISKFHPYSALLKYA